MSLHEERVTYETIKAWVLESYFRGCRDNAIIKGWPHEQIMGYVSYQFEGTFERPVEKLMYNVVLLILSGGWYESPKKIISENILSLIEEFGLNRLLADLPKEELENFLYDLKSIKIA